MFRDYLTRATLGEVSVYDIVPGGRFFSSPIRKPVLRFKSLERPWVGNLQNVSCFPANGEAYYDENTEEVVVAPLEYIMKYERSEKFSRIASMKAGHPVDVFLWEIYGTPNRSECKWHSASFARQLNGCPAPGDMHIDLDGDSFPDIRNSRKTLEKLHGVLPEDEEHVLIVKHHKYPNYSLPS